MARARTTKKLAQRIDLNYFQRPTPLKHAKFWLSLSAPLFALLWLLGRGSSDLRVYSSGSLSRAHAVLEKDCAACHLPQPGGFSAKAADRACLDCHDGPAHHSSKIASPVCATCHAEHRGRVAIAAASDQGCATCHADLRNSQPDTRYASRIQSLQDGHPEFAALRQIAEIPGGFPTIKLNHSVHMKPIRRGPNGILVNLECGNCHRPAGVAADRTYSDAKYRAATVSYDSGDEILPTRAEALRGPKPMTGRELMAPVKFANACAACHLLTFDRRFEEGVPHDKTEVVHAFMLKKFQQYIATHPGELRVTGDPAQELGGKPSPPQVRVFTVSQWVTERVAEAEELLWRKTCKQCHALTVSGDSALPRVATTNAKTRWMPHAKFDHDAHRGFSCVSCHAKALTSTEATDILLPGIAVCRSCHGPDRADARCSECHTYHDWSRRKEVTPKFTLPALSTGGQ